VMINPTDSSVKTTIKVPHAATRAGTFYITDKSRDLAEIKRQPLSDLAIPPQSVCTLVLDR